MWKLLVLGVLTTSYLLYSGLVYTVGTSSDLVISPVEQKKINQGKLLFQEYNCIACHQLYGLGGYLGPDLTNAYSDSNRGEWYIKAFLQNGGRRMPNFKLTADQTEAVTSYLKYVDSTSR
jgi:nitric oxide reductase subunit C